jgi:phosphoglycerate dehydrogenase-like enzyme
VLKAKRVTDGDPRGLSARNRLRRTTPFLTLPNFIAPPLVAGVTCEAVDRMGVDAVENILSVLAGKPDPRQRPQEGSLD